MKTTSKLSKTCLLMLFALFTNQAAGQVQHSAGSLLASSIIVPQARSFSAHRQAEIQVAEISAGVVILEQAATTTMDISLRNPTSRRVEAELAVPVPEGAVVRTFTFHGTGTEPAAALLPKNEATRTYQDIVAKVRDPALLEFIGCNLIRSSIFPVEARGTQKVRLTYEHILHADGNRVDYVLPRTESLDYSVPWKVSVRIKSKEPISTVYSPSHQLEMTRINDNIVSARIAEAAATQPGPFRLSYLLEHDGVTASLFAYPDLKADGGYFLLFAGLPSKPSRAAAGHPIKRELTLVLDRSGSMSGKKIEQVRQAALQVLAGLEEGEAFNIVAYNDVVDLFSKTPVLKTDEAFWAAQAYIKGINVRGGTNIHDALLEGLRQKPIAELLPIVLFLTDGLPTVGQTSEVAIRNVAINANPYNRRIFTFGVGVDVNTPLLERIASETRAAATFVLPKEDVEVKVSRVFKRLSGPVLADARLDVVDDPSKKGGTLVRVRDVIPSRLPDVFEGDQLVVLGQYIGEGPLTFELAGNYLGKERTFHFTFDLDKATTRNAFVPRLWASRKIGVLVDAIRQLGADVSPVAVRSAISADPKLKELVDEVVSLSTQFGILTEYTAFLAREGTDLTRRDEVLAEANRNFISRAVATRSGLASVNQSANTIFNTTQSFLNGRNEFFDQNMNRVAVTTVQQVNDMAFYRRGDRWVDSRIVGEEVKTEPGNVIQFGSGEFRKLALRLAEQHRQGAISLNGDILMMVDGQPVLVKGPVR